MDVSVYVDGCDMEEGYADGTVEGVSAADEGALVGVGGFGDCRLINPLIHSLIKLWPAYNTFVFPTEDYISLF